MIQKNLRVSAFNKSNLGIENKPHTVYNYN